MGKRKPADPHLADSLTNLRAEIAGFQQMTGLSSQSVARLCGSCTLWTRLMVEGRPIRRETAESIRQRLAGWLAARRAEAEVIRKWRGYIELDRDGSPVELPDEISPLKFRRLIKVGYVVPSNDAMFGAASQTCHPIEFSDGAAAV